MNSMQIRYDLIIFTARTEEMFFLEKYFNPSKDPFDSDIYYTHYPANGSDSKLKIGFVNMGVMGNLNASFIATQIFESLLPKSALMIGLAAAYKPRKGNGPLKLCDVGYSNEIIYYSYGKIYSSNKLHTIRNLGTISRRKYISSAWLDGCAKDQNWKMQMNDWFDEWKIEFNAWENKNKNINSRPGWLKTIDINELENYTPQFIPNPHEIVAKEVNIASGELVIANKRYVEHVRESHNSLDISMFDMESYALAQVAAQYRIPFFTIKGVSDFADSPPPWYKRMFSSNDALVGIGKSDKFRYAAIAASSAFCLHLLNSDYKKHVVDVGQPFRPKSKKIFECLYPEKSILCPHLKTKKFHPCINSEDILIDESISYFTKAIENISPRKFSRNIMEKIPLNIEKKYITSFFPYSPQELIRFIEMNKNKGNKNVSIYAKDILSLYDKNKNNDENYNKDIIEIIKNLVDSIKDEYIHFKTWEHYASVENDTHEHNREQPNLSRVIIFSEEEFPSYEEILSDPINMIYPLLLGRHVSTFYTSAGKLNDEGAIATDVTFIHKKNKEENDFSYCISIRFYSQSKTLLLSGIPCLHVKDIAGVKNNNLDILYDLWEKYWNSTDTFPQFPISDIYNKYIKYIQ